MALDNFPSQQSTKRCFGIRDGARTLELPFDWVLKGIELLWDRGLYGYFCSRNPLFKDVALAS